MPIARQYWPCRGSTVPPESCEGATRTVIVLTRLIVIPASILNAIQSGVEGGAPGGRRCPGVLVEQEWHVMITVAVREQPVTVI